MSISKFQEKFLGKGCGVGIGILMALVFLGLGFNQCSRGTALNRQGDSDEPDAVTIAKVGGIPLTTDEVTAAENSLAQQSQGNDSYSTSARMRGQAISLAASQAALAYIAERDHIQINDDAVLKVRQSQVQQQIQQAEDALIASKKLQNPTPSQIADAFAAQYKKKPQEILDQSADAVKKQLADKTERPQLIAAIIPSLVEQALETKLTPSDEVLKSTYDTYTTKRIFLSTTKNPNLDAAVAKVEEALKGGMSFDAAIDKFSNDPVPPGKKLSANTTPVPAQLIDYEPDYKSIKGQKLGFVSEPVSVMGGKAIFKIVGVKNSPPKDFQTNIAKYRTDYAKAEADKEMQKEITEVLSGSTTTWNSPGYKALYDAQAALTNPTLGNSPAALQKVVDEAKAARTGTGGSQVPASDAYFLAFDSLYNSPGADKSKMRDERIDVLNAVLQSNEDFDLRMELVDLYAQKKDVGDAIGQLQQAAQANTLYDVTGQRHFGDIAAKRANLIKLGLAKESDLASIDAAQDAWKKGKQAQDLQDAELKKEEAKQRAAQAKLDQQNAEELKRQKAEAAKSSPPVSEKSKFAPTETKPNDNSSTGSLTPPVATAPGGK